MPKPGKPTRDKVTGKIYPTEGAAGRDLGPSLVPDAKQDNWVWFKMHRAHPDRFQTMVDGDWVDYPPTTTADELRRKRDELLPTPRGDLLKFSVTYRGDTAETPAHYLIEAEDRVHADQILREEFGPALWPEIGDDFEWSTHDTPEWRSAWRHRTVQVLKPTTIPDGIQ